MNRIIALVITIFIMMLVGSSMIFIVDQRKYAIVFSFGEVKKIISAPGLHLKAPPPFQNVVYMDKRIQTIDNLEADRYITSEKKNLLVDLFVKWRIIDPRKFYISVRSDASLAQDRLIQVICAALNEEFTKRTVSEVVSNEREIVMKAVRKKVERDASNLGIDIVDVRLRRVDLLENISESVYQRMKAERQQVANKQRSTGAAEAERIRADADKQREVVIANAYKKAQEIKGNGDAKAAAIYANAFGRDPKFYAFYKSLEAYRRSMGKGDIVITDPNSEFFRFMKNPAGLLATPTSKRSKH
ncbi:protease modulator HflC [Candidatus Vallotia lariciata]|uniref:protease modulator HflC n=1 Tax=Candidatus Vallotia laricis TaxID=2018052 RepID=UPI001D032F6C|nr:protease modulator HflC [Candidatus Vallotia lariciata]UDG83101.1 Modulator of FtsH protease HflC [Candidatus Vallotia lariciata]